MGDMIDRDAVLAAIDDVRNSYRSENEFCHGGKRACSEASSAIRALPAAPAEDVRAEALKEAADRVKDAWEPGKGLRLSEVLALIPEASP